MKFLKGLVLSLLSFLLFLSLSIFGFAFILNNTVLNPDFVISELDKLDVTSLARDLVSEQIVTQIPPGLEFMAEVIDDTITDLDPWIREELSNAIYSGYDYFLGKSQSLSLVISLEPVKEKLRDNAWEALLKSPPPELAMVPKTMWEQYFNQFYEEFAGQIPSSFEFNESSFPPEVMAPLEQIRQAISYAQQGYNVLIGFILLLILGIILINHQVRGATRELGTIFLTYGAFQYAGIFVAKHFAVPQLVQLPIPSQLQAWLPQLLADLLAPLEMFSLGLLIGGVVLLIVSFVYPRIRPSQPSTETAPS